MAVRIHVTAARDCPADEVRATFTEILGPSFQAVPIHEHSGWVWFSTSVWGVGGSDLNTGLCALARPALQFTTSDGSRWFLTVHGSPRGRETFLHEFHTLAWVPDPSQDDEQEEAALDRDEPGPIDPALAFLEDEPERPSRPRRAFDEIAESFAESGAPLPESLSEELRALPYSRAIDRLRAWLADEFLAALDRAGIPVDTDRVRGVLLWQGVTEREHESDLGNLPRLLSALGLGGEWDEHVRQSESAALEDEEDESDDDEADDDPDDGPGPEPPASHARRVYDLVDHLPMTPIEGGPVGIAPAKLNRLGFPSEACTVDFSPMMAVRIEPPDPARRVELLPPQTRREEVQVESTPGGYLLGLLNRLWFRKGPLEDQGGPTFSELLRRPPDGTAIEVAFAVPDQPATYQRFSGTVIGGKFRVERSHPPLSGAALADAIRLAAFESKETIACRDDAEAEALERAALRDSFLHNMGVRRDGKTVAVECDTGNLARLLLRLRHPDSWDFRPFQAREAQQYQERLAMERKFRQAGVEAARNRAAPHEPEVLLRGKHSWYWRSDFLQLDRLDPEPRERFDAAMARLGFHHVGDLVAKAQRDIVLRVFQSADLLAYGVLMGKRTMYLGSEFVSRLSDGSGLTTTTNGMVESVPEAGVYYRIFSDLDHEALFEKHLEGLDRFRKHKAVGPVPLEASLVGVAWEIELAFERRASAEQD